MLKVVKIIFSKEKSFLTKKNIIFEEAKKNFFIMGFSQEKCDQLKNDRKNIYNKIYRRRKKMEVLLPSSSEFKLAFSEVESLKTKVDILNGQIWRCTEQYSNLVSEKSKIKSKIRYRSNKLKTEKLTKDEISSKRNELRDLKASLSKVETVIFHGSDRYKNLKSSTLKINRKIQRLKRNYKQNYSDMSKSERLKIVEEIKNLADQKKMLDEAIDSDKISEISRDRVKFKYDDSEDTETYEETIFQYSGTLDMILARKKYKLVFLEDEEFSYPKEIIDMQFRLSQLDMKNAENGSGVVVVIQADNLNKTVSVVFENN